MIADLVTVQDAGIARILSAFPVRPAVADEQMLENVLSALARNLPVPAHCTPHETLMQIVAGGPSIADTIEDIRAPGSNRVTCAVNGSLGYLLERGITPWAAACLDPRPHMADVLVRQEGVFYFLASTCHPDVFDKLDGCDVILWHPLGMPGLLEAIGDRVGIGGGSTMGLRWFTLGHYMGFRRFEAHGLDSSFRGGATHAYPDWRDAYDAQELYGYRTSFNFLQQVADYFDMVRMFDRAGGVSIDLRGDGLLQHCVRTASC